MARKRASQAEGRNCEEWFEKGENRLSWRVFAKVKGNLKSTRKGPRLVGDFSVKIWKLWGRTPVKKV